MKKGLLEEALYVTNDVYTSISYQQQPKDDNFEPLRALKSIIVDIYTQGFLLDNFLNPYDYAYEHITQWPIARDLYLHLGGAPEVEDHMSFLVEHPHVFFTPYDGIVLFKEFYEPVDSDKVRYESLHYIRKRFYNSCRIDVFHQTIIPSSYVSEEGIALNEPLDVATYSFAIRFKSGTSYIKHTDITDINQAVGFIDYTVAMYAKFYFNYEDLFSFFYLEEDNYIYEREEY